MQQYLSSHAVVSLRPLQAEQISILLKNLLNCPEEFRNHINQLVAEMLLFVAVISRLSRMSAAGLMKLTYGHNIVSGNDKFVSLAIDTTTRGIAAGIPGMTPVDFFPIREHVELLFCTKTNLFL